MRVFAEEVAPAVRELVERGRGEHAAAEEPAGAVVAPSQAPDGARPLTTTPRRRDAGEPRSPSGTSRAARRGPRPEPGARYTPDQQAAGQHLIDVHDGLRGELERLRDLVAQLEAGGR